MSNILNEIVSNKRAEIEQRKNQRTQQSIARKVTTGDGSFLRAIASPDEVHFICELKPKSPSAGVLQDKPDLNKIVAAYDRFASGISVLTDEKYFGGSLELLAQITRKSKRPTLCKDFIIDTYQCYEAREAGAQAALLIVKILDDRSLQLLHRELKQLKMTAVVEVQSTEELQRALKIQPDVILINNRNLETFEIDFATTEVLAPQIPAGIARISASGISESIDIERLQPFCPNFLIGSSLMAAPDLEEKLARLTRTQPQQKLAGKATQI
jgi:indole-3-glycerol phosphate synthase/phosphoribosylanthranilate isomerase